MNVFSLLTSINKNYYLLSVIFSKICRLLETEVKTGAR